MEHLNNDMDHLFRKAGDLYPLRTNESDWDAVLSKLREEISRDKQTGSGLNARGKQNVRRWLLLLLLIPIGVSSLIYFSGSRIAAGSPPPSMAVNPDKNSETIPVESNSDKFSGAVNPSASNPVTANINLKQADKTGIRNNRIPNNKSSGLQAGALSVNEGGNNRANSITSTGNQIPVKSEGSTGKIQATEMNNALPADGNLSTSGQVFTDTDPESFSGLRAKSLSLSVAGTNEMVSVTGKPFSKPAHTSLKTVSGGASLKSKAEHIPGSKGIYAGILAGPDLSSVDFQSIKHPGLSLGVSLGYRFNKHFAIETGLLWDNKYYYSSGEYFNKSKTNIPDNVNIVNVDGNCNMFEIPLNLRYDFASRANHGFFVKAGMSTYLMKKENYNYLADLYGIQYQHDATYKNSTNNIFSILQLSGGYEQTLSEKTKIFVEPYVKIPVQGIGIGNMPISSAGFYIGISYSFH